MLLIHTLAASPRAVFACLADIHRFVTLHPYLFEAMPVDAPDTWRCRERITLLGIPVKFSYPVHVVAANAACEVVMTSQVNPMVHLVLRFRVMRHEEGTRVEEEVTIKALAPVRWLFSRILIKAHRALFATIPKTGAEA